MRLLTILLLAGTLAHAQKVVNRGGGTAAASNDPVVDSIIINAPGSYTNGHIQIKKDRAWTITRLSCSTDVGTVDIMPDERAESTPNSAGTNVLSSALQCTTTTAATTTFSNATVDADDPLSIDIDATAGSPTVARFYVEYTYD